MIVALDMDSVLVECNRKNIARLNEHFDTDHEYEDITDFDYGFLTEEQRMFMYEVCWHDPTQYDELGLSQEWQNTLTVLRDICRVVVCSSPLVGHIESKQRFLERYFDRDDIILARDKALACAAAEILVDDAPHNIETFPNYGIVYDRPWNQEVDAPRAYNPTDVGKLVWRYAIDNGYMDTKHED